MEKITYILLMIFLSFCMLVSIPFASAGTPCGSSGISDPTCTETVKTCYWQKTTLYNCGDGSGVKCYTSGSCGGYSNCASCGGVSSVPYPYDCYKNSCTGSSVCNNAASGYWTPPSSYSVKECYYISSYDYTSCQNAGGGVGYRYATNPVWSKTSGSSCSNIAISDDGPYSWSTAGDITGCCEYLGGTFRTENSDPDCPLGYDDGSKGCCTPASDCFLDGVCKPTTTKLGSWPQNAYCNSGTWQGGDDSKAACDSIAGSGLWGLGGVSPCCGDDATEFVNYQEEQNTAPEGDIEWVNGDSACCNDALDNVGANNNCVASYVPTDGSAVDTESLLEDMYGVSSTDGIAVGWMECDLYSNTYCNNVGPGFFALAGEHGVGEYQDPTGVQDNGGRIDKGSNEFGFAETCGDDANEYYITSYIVGADDTPIDGPFSACCDTESDCVNESGHCITDGTVWDNGEKSCHKNKITVCNDTYNKDCDESGTNKCVYDGNTQIWQYYPGPVPPECCGDFHDNDCDEDCEDCTYVGQPGCDHCFEPDCLDCLTVADPGCYDCPLNCVGCTHPTDPGCINCFDPCFDCPDSSVDPRCALCGGGPDGGDDEDDPDCIFINGTVYEEIFEADALSLGYVEKRNNRYYNPSVGANVTLKYKSDLSDLVNDYGRKVTDSDGKFNLSTDHNKDTVIYFEKEDAGRVPVSFGLDEGMDHINLQIFLSYESECTDKCSIRNAQGRYVCDEGCQGVNGCDFGSVEVKNACTGAQEGWDRTFDLGGVEYEVVCCDGNAFTATSVARENFDVEAEAEVKNLLTHSRIVNYKGEIVTMYITTWEE